MRDGRVSHAYLFSGPRGTGKTSSARILAKALNCEAPVDGEPCGVCASCLEITAGNSMNVHELDAASNNGVDAMRDLVAHAGLGTPGRWKIYIVDEVHMLSTAAANALLKTLEEPPAHVVFVLATTDPQKVPPTIRSRTQHLEFRLLGAETLTGLLESVNDSAGLGLDETAVSAAVRRGRGSARDALSALDQVMAAGSSEAARPELSQVIDPLAAGSAPEVLVAVSALLSGGWGAQPLATELIDDLRQVFLAALAPDLCAVAGAERDRYTGLAEAMGLPRVVRSIEILGQALIDMREAPDAQVVLEIALVRAVRPDLDSGMEALSERVAVLERSVAGAPAFPRPGVAAGGGGGAAVPTPAPASAPGDAGSGSGCGGRRGQASVTRGVAAEQGGGSGGAGAGSECRTRFGGCCTRSDGDGGARTDRAGQRGAGRHRHEGPACTRGRTPGRSGQPHRGVGRHHSEGTPGAGQSALQRGPLRLGRRRRRRALRVAQRGAPRPLRRNDSHRRVQARRAFRDTRPVGARGGRRRAAGQRRRQWSRQRGRQWWWW